MPGSTTVQNFPYPFLTEGATPVSVQNLANQVDSKLSNQDVSRALAMRKDTAQARRSAGNQSITINTQTVLTFDTEDWDINNLNVSGTPDRLTVVRTGLYWIWGSYILESMATTGTVVEAAIRVSGTSVIFQKEGQPAVTGDRRVGVQGMYRVTATQTIQLHAYWFGSAGTTLNAREATLGARLVAI